MSIVHTLGIPARERHDMVVLCDKMFKMFCFIPILKKGQTYFQKLKASLHVHSSSFIFSK